MKYEYKFENSFIGKIITLSNGTVEFSVSLDVGPRIISFKTVNGENIMFNDYNDVVSKDISHVYGEGKVWHIYGGHRLWLSPEEDATYYPDNGKVSYQMTENGIIVSPGIWKKTNVIPKMEINFIDSHKIEVKHQIKNTGDKREFCIWGLTVMKAGGELKFNLSNDEKQYLPNRNLVFWPYDDLCDKRFRLENGEVYLKSDVSIPEPYKIGAFNSHFRAIYNIELNGQKVKFIKKTLNVPDNGNYPDYCCNFECYCSNYIHEIESLSQIKVLEKDGIMEHTEFWEIY